VLAYVAYVVRQPYDAYPSGLARAARISPAVLVPVVGMSIYKIVEAVFGAMLRHTNKRIDKVNERSERIVQNLKDDMKFDRTEKLLRKYDREWVNPIGAAAGAGAGAGAGATGKGSSGSLHEAGNNPEEIPAANATRTTMVTPTNAGLHTRSGSGKPPMSLSKKLMMSTVGGASMKLSGALAQLWTLTADTVIGDDPVLLRSLKNAEVHAQSLTEENSRLREKLERYESEFGIMEEAAEGGEEDRGAAADGRGGDDVDEASVEVKPLLLADDVGGDAVGDDADDDGSGDDESDRDDDNEAIEMVVGDADEDGSNDDGSGDDDDDDDEKDEEDDEEEEEEAIEMVVGEAEEDPHAEEAQDDPPPSPPPRRSRRARTRI